MLYTPQRPHDVLASRYGDMSSSGARYTPADPKDIEMLNARLGKRGAFDTCCEVCMALRKAMIENGVCHHDSHRVLLVVQGNAFASSGLTCPPGSQRTSSFHRCQLVPISAPAMRRVQRLISFL